MGTSLEILVHPPFWETWWFRSATAAFLGGAGFLVYKRRTLLLKRRAAQLRNLSMHIQNAREEERKAAMVSNLLVVLCGDQNAQPVVNAGTLYQ